MAKVLIYYAHPGQKYSQVNHQMFQTASRIPNVTAVDLYAKYPTYNIDVDAEQQLLIEHDVIIFQFPIFWYSSPSLIKEWLDLVLEHGFAFGGSTTKLKDKVMMLAISAAGSQQAYSSSGHQNYPLRTYLTPFEQTASLCKMRFFPPYALYSSLEVAGTSQLQDHIEGYLKIIKLFQNNSMDWSTVQTIPVIQYKDLNMLGEV